MIISLSYVNSSMVKVIVLSVLQPNPLPPFIKNNQTRNY